MNREQLKKLVMEEMSKLTVDEMGCPSDMPKQDHDHEGKMHRSSLFKMAKYSVELLDMIQDADDLPEWVESKITKAADYLGVVKHYLEADDAREMGALEEVGSNYSDPSTGDYVMPGKGIRIGSRGQALSIGTGEPIAGVVDKSDMGEPHRKMVAKAKSQKELARQFLAKNPGGKSVRARKMLINKFRKMGLELDNFPEFEVTYRKFEEQEISEDMVHDVFTEVNENFTIYDTVQDAITEDGDHACPQCLYEVLSDAACGCPDLVPEAEYRGRKVKLNKPMRGDVKKFKVFVKDPKTGNVKKVNFGDKKMRIKKSNPKRRKSFRARHNCKNPGPKTKARYWSCRKW